MSLYKNLTKEELKKEHNLLMKKYEEFRLLNLNLNMARGKPSLKQLDLSLKMLTEIDIEKFKKTKEKLDTRNYGGLNDLIEPKQFFSKILDLPTEMIFVGDNSSLNLMSSYVNMAMQFGILNQTPWNKLEKIKFLCPSPGYDRHFAICDLYDIEMIIINTKEDGPDVEQIKELVEKDELIKGIWCVPKYSNPTGITYSEDVVKKIAALKPKAKDFRVFWDNAYIIHGFSDEDEKLLNIFPEAEKNDNLDMILEFCSTSKITFPGSGISAIAASKNNIDNFVKILSRQIICFDRINQIRHCEFFSKENSLKEHMKKHAKIIKPKFDLVLEKFEEELKPLNIASWSKPKGGYFISFNSLNGCAKKIYDVCKNLGVILTSPGATFPKQKDPKDCNIRIAPTYPEIEELKTALDVFCLAVKIVSIEKILQTSYNDI